MPFEKYQGLLGAGGGPMALPGANGRPVGVRNGMGQQPATPTNPVLGGLKTSPVPVAGIPQTQQPNRQMIANQIMAKYGMRA